MISTSMFSYYTSSVKRSVAAYAHVLYPGGAEGRAGPRAGPRHRILKKIS